MEYEACEIRTRGCDRMRIVGPRQSANLDLHRHGPPLIVPCRSERKLSWVPEFP
jgi:hypothetical protein